MIIAFYPGGGGNRYLQKVLGNTWTKPNISYDGTNPEQKYVHRYLLEPMPKLTNTPTLTHCMNCYKIVENLQSADIVFIHTDLKQSTRREWMLHGHSNFMKKKINDTVHRLDHYRAFKDHDWPDVDTIEQLENLPQNILKETNNDYEKIQNPAYEVPGKLKQLTQQYVDQINSAYEIITWIRDYYQKFPVDFSICSKVIDVEKDNDEFSVFMRHELSLYQSTLFDSVWDTICYE